MSQLEKAEMLIRKSLSEEEKAISDYLERKHTLEKMLDKAETEDFLIKIQTYLTVLEDIIEEEQLHVGQLRQLLNVFELPLTKEQEGREETLDSYTEVMQQLDIMLKED